MARVFGYSLEVIRRVLMKLPDDADEATVARVIRAAYPFPERRQYLLTEWRRARRVVMAERFGGRHAREHRRDEATRRQGVLF